MKAVIRLDVPEWQIGTEVAVYFKDTMMQRGICEKETENIKFKQPEKCKDCVSCHTHSTGNSYCGMATAENPEMNITTIYIKDINTRPDWCPIVRLNKSLEEMPQEKRDQFNVLAKGLAALFGDKQGFEIE